MTYSKTMNYILVTPGLKRDDLASVRVVPEGFIVSGPYEAWALNDGKRILFADSGLHRLVKHKYMLGSHTTGAVYAYPFEEMVRICESKIGLGEKGSYEAALLQQATVQEARPKVRDMPSRWPQDLFNVLKFIGFVIWRSAKFLLIMGLIPIIISIFKGRK